MEEIASRFRRLTRRIGHRGSFLLFLALLDFLYGYSLYITPSAKLHLDLVLSLQAWGGIWFAVGVLLLLGAFARRDRIHYGVSATLKAAWAAVWVKLWVFQSFPQAWVEVVLWAGFASLVIVVSTWPEIRRAPKRDVTGPE